MSIEEYKAKIMELLKPFGIAIETSDFSLEFAVQSTIQDILNFCNLKEIPKELEHVVIRRVLANLIGFKLQTDGAESMNIEKGIKSISEGDVSITYYSSIDKGALLNKFIQDSKNYGLDNLYSFRDFRW
ncbi:hypothetical protein [Peptostreptococcus equinus]|uniref:Phage gp6-like head-tail connector protein n=1 Tax=Peptostreptococcus equinus TaxID=3003601 RepID=A0ABY7JU09_9FIRM|nr:hypothetical protein [Peptostreptococcus sp. CBA3647]WAW15450.1 hypothetical protein O0R46_03120 [Peptostreptococcus sp. CBA3647]